MMRYDADEYSRYDIHANFIAASAAPDMAFSSDLPSFTAPRYFCHRQRRLHADKEPAYRRAHFSLLPPPAFTDAAAEAFSYVAAFFSRHAQFHR